jgi:murein lipoprotein
MKKLYLPVISAAVLLGLGGCASNNSDPLQAQIDQLQSEVKRLNNLSNEAVAEAKSAGEKADMAMDEAVKAQQMARDSEEKAERMFERCCGK